METIAVRGAELDRRPFSATRRRWMAESAGHCSDVIVQEVMIRELELVVGNGLPLQLTWRWDAACSD